MHLFIFIKEINNPCFVDKKYYILEQISKKIWKHYCFAMWTDST